MNTFLVRSAHVLNRRSKFLVRQANAEYVDMLDVRCTYVRSVLSVGYML